MFLYKYRGVENLDRDLKCLSENYFWASDIESLNDEQECLFNDDVLCSMLEFLPICFPDCVDSISEVKERWSSLKQTIKGIGVFSLSRNAVIPSMWALYASNLEGYCVIYDKDRLLQCTTPLCTNDVHIFDVIYTEEVPCLTNFRSLELQKMVATKFTCWQQEEETRLVVDHYGKRHHLPSAIHGIIFGTKMTEENKSRLKDTLAGRNVKFFQLQKKGTAYGYTFHMIEEYKIPSPFSEGMYTYKVYPATVLDNYYVKLNFRPKDKEEIVRFVEAFKQKHTERQHNLYIHDLDTKVEKLSPERSNYDYLQEHLIVETIFDCKELFFYSDFK